MTVCFFVTDLHGDRRKYARLLEEIVAREPDLVLLGGDICPSGFGAAADRSGWEGDFLEDFLAPRLEDLRAGLGGRYPAIVAIQGNDDPAAMEQSLSELEDAGLWTLANMRRVEVGRFSIHGYPYVVPSPFMLKDWERYDVSRYADPGCVSPEEGMRSAPAKRDPRWATIAEDLAELFEGAELGRTVLLAHSPPYGGFLDRAALDGRMIDHVPLDVHIGSIAVRRFIEERQPLLTLHGHVHESVRLTGHWKERSGRTVSIGGAHDGPELALVILDLEAPLEATRELL